MKLIFQILAGIGFFLLAAAGLTYIQSTYFITHAQLTTGTVMALYISNDPDTNANAYCPEVSFTTQTGQSVTFEANVCSTPDTYKVGDQIELYYDPQNPQGAQIKSFGAQYLVSMSLLVSGLPITLVSVLGLFLQKKRQRQGVSI